MVSGSEAQTWKPKVLGSGQTVVLGSSHIGQQEKPNNLWGAQNCLNFYSATDHLWDDQVCAVPARFLCSQMICSDTKDTWSSTTLATIGGSVAFLLVLLLVVLLCIFKKRRNRRNAADVTRPDENPVYGTYFDPNPRAEVVSFLMILISILIILIAILIIIGGGHERLLLFGL